LMRSSSVGVNADLLHVFEREVRAFDRRLFINIPESAA